jgi:hypothetical protein
MKKGFFIFLFFAAWLWSGQTYLPPDQAEEETVASRLAKLDPLAQEAFRVRLAELIEEKLSQCRESAVRNAGLYVDSLIMEEALQNRRLEHRIPPKPARPEAPDIKTNLDTIQVKPLFDSSIN